MNSKQLDNLREQLSREIPEQRFRHTLGVEKEAVWYAQKLGADAHKAAMAGLLHDVTKMWDEQRHRRAFATYGAQLSEVEWRSPKLFHPISGALVAQHLYGVEDREILDAIRYHTTARSGMTLLDKIVYMADFTEEGRTFPGAAEVRDKAHRDFHEGYRFALDFSIREIVSKGVLLHPGTVAARNEAIIHKGV
ncbi:MAG: bis(5'-nucleosyl)-tetraphosphatase (symmetrical) YqeK [Eubacteriales bacterium]|jgi:predicted HD superfamily hydrolase involved in NAD metabolism